MTSSAPSRRDRWNARHREAAAGDGGPSCWLLAQRDLLEPLAPGRALDLACGRGRNAFFLAELGFDVDGIDISDVAVEVVEARARATGLPVRAVRADLEREPLARGAYHVVVVFDYLERSLLDRIRQAMAPGALLVFETFTEDHPRMNPAYVLRRGELIGAFGDLAVLRRYESGGRAGIVARRP